MIRINLLRQKKSRKVEEPPAKPALREVRIGTPVKIVKIEHLIFIALWLGVFGTGIWYWEISTELTEVKREIDQLQAEKNRLTTVAKQVEEEKKKIESEIAQLNAKIASLEHSRDIFMGLRELYISFNNEFRSFSSSVPPTSWMITYSQTLDLENGKLKTDFELSSFDYASISAYTSGLRKANNEVFVSSIERKTNPSGYEYYLAKLTAEKTIGGK